MAGALACMALPRQLILSAGFVDGSLAKRHFWWISCGIPSKLSSCLPGIAHEALFSQARHNIHYHTSKFVAGKTTRFYHDSLFKQMMMVNSMSLAVPRDQISTVARRATFGSKVGISSESTNMNREIMVQHLLLKEDQVQLLIELQRQVGQEGIDLSDLAEEYSECPSKAQGGMLGWIQRGQTDLVFEEAAFSAPLNKLVRVKTKHGLHLLQVLNERDSRFLEQIQIEQFHERMQDPNFVVNVQLIDVREPSEISLAAIDGFQAYPLSQFGQWAPNIADDLDPKKDTYVLCHHGMRSMQAASWLQSQGFTRLYNIAGGIHAYSLKVDSSIPTY